MINAIDGELTPGACVCCTAWWRREVQSPTKPLPRSFGSKILSYLFLCLATSSYVAPNQSFTVLSVLAEASVRPSGENATNQT